MPTGWLGWDWGNVPSWVGSVLTSSSLAIAAVTYVRNAHERRRENDERTRTQAALVSSWPVNPRRWRVRNANSVAVSVQALIDDGARSDQIALSPGETRGLRLPADMEVRGAFLPLLIVDSFGRRWLRQVSGELTEITGPTPPTPASAPQEGGSVQRLVWEERS
jgi:hypothetical protein